MKKMRLLIVVTIFSFILGISIFVAPKLHSGVLENLQLPGGNNFMLIQNLLSKDCDEKCEVLVFVEAAILRPLQKSFNVWKKDIEKEFHANVVIRPVKKNPDPDSAIATNEIAQNIKKTIWDYEKREGTDIFAVLFVGDVPSMRAYISRDDDANYLAEGLPQFYPSDWLYRDDKNRCAYNPNIYAYNLSAVFGCMYDEDRMPFVIGRLKPNGNKAARISLLKKYFQRNHLHRTFNNSYGIGSGELLVNKTMFDGIPDREDQEGFVGTEKKRLEWLLPTDRFKFLSPLTQSDDAAYLKELRNNYSAVYFNGHGTPEWHEYNVTPRVLKKTKPQALYYSMKSCSVGDISRAENIASHYLFDGNGLFVYSNSIVILAGHPITRDIYYLISGVPIYKYYSKFLQGNYLSSTILMGDPTLSLKKQNKAVPDIKIRPYDIDFGRISLAEFGSDNFLLKQYEWGVENHSGKPIYIDEKTIVPQFTGDTYGILNAVGIILRLTTGHAPSAVNEPFSTEFGVKVEPNTQASGTLMLSLEKDTILAAANPYRKFQGALVVPIYSAVSDQTYILDIPFKGEIIR